MEQKKLKIAFLSRYQGKVNRGVESYVVELSKRLSQKYQIEILSGHDSDSFSKITGGGYDVVIPTNGRLQALKASLGRISGKYKVIISGQAGVGRDDIWNIFITRPDVYVALTDFELNWAKKWAWGTKVAKIPNGVDLEKFSPDGSLAKIDLPRPLIISVGALEWYKHHELTINALSNLQNVSLLIIGSGRERDKLLKLGNTKLGGKRFKIISVDFKEIPAYYRAGDLFTLPSWDREAFGIVYVEAMSSNLSVVAPDDLPRREIIGNAGILVDVNNEKKYAAAISQALSKGWGLLPRQQAEKFSWDKIASQYEKLLEDLFK